MRIAFIGTGWVTGIHMDALAGLADVVGVAGRNQDRLKELQIKSGAIPYSDYREMLKKEKPDAVFLALTPHLHGEVEEVLADHVRGVLVEKPLANSWESVLRAQKAFEKAGTLVSVAYQNRYREGARRAREHFLASPNKPVSVNGWWIGGLHQPLWWRNKAESGGQFVEQCTHVVDLARYIVGEVAEVHAWGTSAFHTDASQTVEDAITVNTRFASGAIGNFSTGCFATGKAQVGIGLTIASRDAVLRFTGWGFESTLQVGDKSETFAAEPNIFEMQARAFIQALTTGDRSLIACDYADGMKSLHVGLAANESMETGRAVVVG